MRLTTARYTPSGVSIQAKGITPDIDSSRASKNWRRHYREEDLKVPDKSNKIEENQTKRKNENKPENASKTDQSRLIISCKGTRLDPRRIHI